MDKGGEAAREIEGREEERGEGRERRGGGRDRSTSTLAGIKVRVCLPAPSTASSRRYRATSFATFINVLMTAAETLPFAVEMGRGGKSSFKIDGMSFISREGGEERGRSEG